MISRIGKLLVETTGAERFSAAQALRATDVVLVVDTSTDPFLAASAVALTLRCFSGNTIVRAVGGRRVPDDLAAAVIREASEYGAGDRLSFAESGGSLSLGLGCSAGDVFVDASGWSVGVNELGSTRNSASTPAAAFAAAAGVAKLFGTLIGRNVDVLRERWSGCLLDFTPDASWDNRLDLGRIILIGAGAIGSAFAHVLRASPWGADVTIVDHQRYEEPNHETTLVVPKEAMLRQVPKARALAIASRSATVATRAVSEKVVEGHRLLSTPVDTIVCAVDNPELRRLLDHPNALAVFNSAVGGAREDAGMVLWTRHRRGDAPLSVHYPLRTQTEDATSSGPADLVTDQCSRLSYASVSLAAPFMALAAGAILTAGIVQEAMHVDAPTNYLKVDMLALQRWMTRKSILVPGS